MDIAPLIDQTILDPAATIDGIVDFCSDAKAYNFASIFVHPTYLSIPLEIFKDHNTAIGSVVDFCFGSGTILTKKSQSKELVLLGVDEIDTVINIGLLKSKEYQVFEEEIRSIVGAAREAWIDMGKKEYGPIIKVIIETGILSDDEKKDACKIVVSAGADYVKTSTSFLGSGATTSDIELMRRAVGDDFGVKASGGIRTLSDLMSMVEAGADRIGTSGGIDIMREFEDRAGK